MFGRVTSVWLGLASISTLLLLGCATPSYQTVSSTRTLSPDSDDNIGGNFFESADVRTIASRMAGGILSTPEIARASGSVKIAVQPVSNSSRFIVDREILTTRLRAELNRNSRGRVRFVAQNQGQDVRAQILAERAREAWSADIEIASQQLLDRIDSTGGSPARVAVLDSQSTNLQGGNADSLLNEIRATMARRGNGAVVFAARDGGGTPINALLGEADLRSLNLVEARRTGALAGIDYFLGGELTARSINTEAASMEGGTGISLNVMLIDAVSGAVVSERSISVAPEISSGLADVSLILTGELRALSKTGGGDRSDYILLNVQLINPDTNDLIWEDIYESKKVTRKSVLYK